MPDMMSFPETVDEFMDSYKIVDTEGIYMSKGAEMVPIFRMKQWFEHISAQPEISRIEQELHGKTPEEQYEFLYWLLLKFGLAYTDSRLAVVEWLRGEKEDGRHDQQTGGD